MKKIAIVGCKGKMGSLISKELEHEFEIFGIDKDDKLENLPNLDLIIDFANHESSVVSAEFALERGIPIIIGSTGQTCAENEKLAEISKQIKLVKKANFSRGVEVLKKFIDNVLELAPEKFEIKEKHHINKKDAPSGTALELQNYIKQKFTGEIKISWVREGDEMGEHEVIALVGDEKLSAKHNVFSRDTFVKGVTNEVKILLN